MDTNKNITIKITYHDGSSAEWDVSLDTAVPVQNAIMERAGQADRLDFGDNV